MANRRFSNISRAVASATSDLQYPPREPVPPREATAGAATRGVAPTTYIRPMTDTLTCPECGASSSGNFCSSCGAPLGERHCTACGHAITRGDRFCRGCGIALAAGAVRPREPRAPWIVAGVLCCVAIAAVVYAAGQRGTAAAPTMANAGNVGGTLDGRRAPPLDDMTPREQFARLNDRVMAAAEAGDSTTVINFWPMAAGAYDNLLPGDRDIDARYHMATLHLLVGQFPPTLALADTILAESPDNLMGWYLRGVVAEFQGDSAAMRTAQAEFRRLFDAELAKGHDEYVHHAEMLRQYQGGGTTP